jgi:hypothetical protein
VRPYGEIDGQRVAMDGCDWVLWAECGCPYGVCTGGDHPTEEDAWKGFYDGWRDIARALRKGHRLELMTHERYCREVSDQMRARCQHQAAP